jgi:hypothetical protein
MGIVLMFGRQQCLERVSGLLSVQILGLIVEASEDNCHPWVFDRLMVCLHYSTSYMVLINGYWAVVDA